jgi:predicted glycoside hydrolase/deacetylase ChbG (UPF0249 family)
LDANPILQKLGLSASTRTVIFHADDVGMCHASLAAYGELVDFGLISSASAMVPCPWFPATAAFCRDNAGDRVDMGVHLTLTSEWKGYRWGPISTRDAGSGLMDATGHFPTRSETVQEQAHPGAVLTELKAQVERALDAGIDVTHVDTHMGSIVHPAFIDAYVHVALQYRVPPFLVRLDEAGLREHGLDSETARASVEQLRVLEAEDLPLLDNMHMMSLDDPRDRVEQVREALDALQPGITYFVIHPALDTPELRAIAPDWRCRVADYETFTSRTVWNYVKSSGIQVIGWRVLRDLMREGD